MMIALFTNEQVEKFRQHLINEERAELTIDKYIRDIREFHSYLSCKTEITKEDVLEYKKILNEKYKATSANSMLVALNQYFVFCSRTDLKVKLFKVQSNSFREKNKELTIKEYKKLVQTAEKRKNKRLSLLIQTICSTGIRVSEHKFVTVDSLRTGKIRIINKGKERAVFLTKNLIKELKLYCKRMGIASGPVFVTRNGSPVNRCNIWAEMKSLCKAAGVEQNKVFPHNLRHLFALTYYRIEKDIVRLADILGHASVETTRIYTLTTAEDCIHSLSRLNLLLI